jgi:dihydrofolate reductase
MRDLVVSSFVTLDGVMQAPGGPEEDPSGGFAYGGWSVTAWDDAMVQVMTEAEQFPCDYVLGRKTYEIFAAHWPHVDDSMGKKLTDATKYVASNTLEGAEWANTVVLSGDVVAKVRELRAGDGPELQVLGSSELIQTLNANDLVDEYRLWIYPVVLGKGKRVFGDDVAAAGLELVDSKLSSTGVLMTTYRKKGPVEIGSFALEEPTEAEVQRRESLKG